MQVIRAGVAKTEAREQRRGHGDIDRRQETGKGSKETGPGPRKQRWEDRKQGQEEKKRGQEALSIFVYFHLF